MKSLLCLHLLAVVLAYKLIFLHKELTFLRRKVLSVIRYFIRYSLLSYNVFQDKNVTEIEKQLIRDFPSLSGWFVHNELSINFVQEKTKSILF